LEEIKEGFVPKRPIDEHFDLSILSTYKEVAVTED
jgi:hypothetical protein